MISSYKISVVLFLLINLFFNRLFAQQVIIGSVKDAITNEPLPGVVIFTPKIGTVTNNLGDFELKLSASEKLPLSLKIRLVGYVPQEFEVTETNKRLNILLQPNNKMLNQLVIAAERNKVNVFKSSATTEIIKPYLIENKITTNLNKIIDQIPSVNVVDGQINIRNGSGWSYGAGSRVLVLLDGMPFLTGDAGQVQWKFLPIENVEQIEVVKGASSVLYGSSALNGTINLTTQKAADVPITKINLFSGVFSKPSSDSLFYPYNNPQYQFGFNAFYANKFGSAKNNSFAIAANYLNDEGYRFGEFDKRLRLNFNLNFKKSKKPVSYGLGGGMLLTNGASFLLWQGFKQRYTALNNQATVTKSTNYYIDPTVVFYSGKFKHDVKTRYLHVKNDVDNITQNQDNSADLFYADYQLSRMFTGLKLMFVSGATAIYTIGKAPLFNGTNKAENAALFLNLEKSFFKNNGLVLNAGVRYEYYALNAINESKPVFRFGANYQLGNYTFLRASFGQGYRFPGIAEKYITTSVGALNIFKNEQLQSETGTNAEFGIKQAFAFGGIKGYADIAFFDTRYNNMIEFNFGAWGGTDIFNTNNLGFKSVNVGSSKINGIDFSIAAQGNVNKLQIQALMGYTYTNPVINNINYIFATDSLGTAYNFRNTRSDSSNILKYRFNHLFKADVQVGFKKLMFGFSLRYNSFIQNIDAAFIYLHPNIPDIAKGRNLNRNGALFTDLRAGYHLNKNFSITLAISNLFNQEAMSRPADMVSPRLSMLNVGYKF